MDIFEFISSIAWQILLIIIIILIIIFRKKTGNFLKDVTILKIKKDGFELEKKIEQNLITRIERSEFLSERFTVEKHAIEALLIWEKINVIIYNIMKSYGFTKFENKFKKFDILKKLNLIDKSLHSNLTKIRTQISEIDKHSKTFEYNDYQIFMAIADECLKKIIVVQDTVSTRTKELYDNLSNQIPIIEGWGKIGDKLLEKIKKINKHLFGLISNKQNNDFTEIKPIFKQFVEENNILNKHQINEFLKYRDLINKVSVFNEEAINELKNLDIELQKQKINKIVKILDEK